MVSLFETIERPSTPPHNNRQNVSSRIRLQLQTMFNHSSSRSRSSLTRSSTPSSSSQSSPSPSYRSYNRHATSPSSDLSTLFSPRSASTLSSLSSFTSTHVRRQPSAIDLALEAERCAVGPENIGLGLLEPRPRGSTVSSITSGSTSSECSILEFMNETQNVPVVLDGIFEVMESA